MKNGESQSRRSGRCLCWTCDLIFGAIEGSEIAVQRVKEIMNLENVADLWYKRHQDGYPDEKMGDVKCVRKFRRSIISSELFFLGYLPETPSIHQRHSRLPTRIVIISIYIQSRSPFPKHMTSRTSQTSGPNSSSLPHPLLHSIHISPSPIRTPPTPSRQHPG